MTSRRPTVNFAQILYSQTLSGPAQRVEALLIQELRLQRCGLGRVVSPAPDLPEGDYTGQSLPILLRRRGGSFRTTHHHSAQ